MADIPSSDILHDMKQTQKDTAHHETVPHEGSSNADSNEKSGKDIEKTASHGAGYELSHLPIDEHGEYVVTMKTWAVVVVSTALLIIGRHVSNLVCRSWQPPTGFPSGPCRSSHRFSRRWRHRSDPHPLKVPGKAATTLLQQWSCFIQIQLTLKQDHICLYGGRHDCLYGLRCEQ